MLSVNLKLFPIFVFLYLISNATWSDCPEPSSVVFHCSNGHCNWSAPWYEGFPDSGAVANMTAGKFVRVYWGAKETQPPQPGMVGTTICFYQNSSTGALIELVQNRWGGVVFPEGKNWGAGFFQGRLGLQCPKNASTDDANAIACHFNYP